MSKENIDYRAIVERIAEILHGGVTDISLLTVTVQAMKERNSNLARQCDELANELNAVEAIHSDAVLITDEHYDKCPPEVQKIIGKFAVMVLPATDSFLRKVRAEAIVFASYHLPDGGKYQDSIQALAQEVLDGYTQVSFPVKQLRQGGAA